MTDDLSDVYGLVAGRLLSGKVVPVLGAGANLYDRPPDVGYQRGRYLPSGRELAEMLARFGRYPMADVPDLARVAQYVAAQLGESSLYDELHDVFDADYPPTPLHYFLARLARHTREAAAAPREAAARECMLIMTTNYDDALERAFRNEGEPYDLVTYINDVETDRGFFRHIPFDGEPSVIRKPNEYTGLPLGQRTVIAKIHGAVDRFKGAGSFVITEDDYVDYISRADIALLFPITLAEKLMKSHFLFLGYSLRDWNFRVMLYRLRREGTRRKSWAIEAEPNPVDQATWDVRGVDIVRVRVESFVSAMEQHLPAFAEPP
ncbi:MAG: SIR2 family NAD-dependent protein deacylase [Pseudonocardiaceae bacterium]